MNSSLKIFAESNPETYILPNRDYCGVNVEFKDGNRYVYVGCKNLTKDATQKYLDEVANLVNVNGWKYEDYFIPVKVINSDIKFEGKRRIFNVNVDGISKEDIEDYMKSTIERIKNNDECSLKSWFEGYKNKFNKKEFI